MSPYTFGRGFDGKSMNRRQEQVGAKEVGPCRNCRVVLQSFFRNLEYRWDLVSEREEAVHAVAREMRC